jgi:hypothetical protein
VNLSADAGVTSSTIMFSDGTVAHVYILRYSLRIFRWLIAVSPRTTVAMSSNSQTGGERVRMIRWPTGQSIFEIGEQGRSSV